MQIKPIMRSLIEKIFSVFKAKPAPEVALEPVHKRITQPKADPLVDEKSRTRLALLDQAFDGIDLGTTKWDLKRFVGVEIQKYLDVAMTDEELQERTSYIENVLQLISKASDLLDKAIAEDARRGIKKHLKESQGYYRMAGLGKVSNRSLGASVSTGNIRSIKPVILGALAEDGVEHIVNIMPRIYEECLEFLVPSSALRRNSLTIFKRESSRLFAPQKIKAPSKIDQPQPAAPLMPNLKEALKSNKNALPKFSAS